MRRAWMIGAGGFACLIVALLAVQYCSTHPQVPPSLEASNCPSSAPTDELPNARFARKGGRTTRYVKVRREGTALTVEDVAQGRDLSQYERLELADPEPRAAADRRRDPILAQARTFLWQHWHNRKRAYLLLTLRSVDTTSTSHVFIEPDEIGRWRVYWRAVRFHSEVDDAPTAYSMNWVIPGQWNQPGTPLGAGQEPDPQKHKLEFRDICGGADGYF